METEKIGELYQMIAVHLNKMIPSQWEQIVLYAEILDDSADIYFYFTTPNNSDYLYSHYIPEQFNVSEEAYDQLLIELLELFEELKEKIKLGNQDIWTNLTLKLENTGKFSIDYNYDDVLSSELDDLQRRDVWKYQNLGILPKDEDEKEFVINYFGL
ncbi:immunity protein YezG family protein [Bacillus atrophaeus]|uniref:immunity protein YezG family protein n=1 Tax=Bacillus atrophaeus TaxID=1452 RepID=UPI000D03E50A|nr:immunity protein YezG family protein [Bacillus atrophaeus]PRR87751.1 TIGR01741 family protein [Bacillus atrophaeus]